MGFLICRVIEKHLGFPMQFMGNIAYDDLVHDAVCQKVPFLNKYSYTQTAADLTRFCKHILVARRPGVGSAPVDDALEKVAEMGAPNWGIESNEAIGRTHLL